MTTPAGPATPTRTRKVRPTPRQRPRAQRALPVLGVVYVLAWLVGLLVAPATPGTVDAGAVHAFFTAHAGGFVLQALLVHGVAGLALAGLTVGIAAAVRPVRTGRWVTGTGLAAAGISLLQVGLGLAAAHDVTHTPADTTTAWLQAVNVADIAKLGLLAALVAATTRVVDRTGRLPRWLTLLGWALVPLLAFGGLAFPLPSPVLTAVLTVSLPALLVWVGATAWRLHQ
ncbi:hypothetical protein [Terrabacter sp. BE26]|uniref:hypothetical protein n=1 Tax=Terrabacter sp. BE26 TaxID=2898152 RepID=UPI0035BE5450